MAQRFAIASGNWSNTAIWDNGAEPISTEDVYTNGFTVTIDKDINVSSLRNSYSQVILPNIAYPQMTGNTQPSGIVIAGSDVSNAWRAFSYFAAGTAWLGTGINSTAWIGYQFPVAKTIKRYQFYRRNNAQRPISWIFQASNNGTTWTDLENIISNTGTTDYYSPVLSNTTSYTYYRIFIVAVTSGTIAEMFSFEMTESTSTSYGTGLGASFTVPASLSGTRNIVQNGTGITTTNATCLTLAHTGSNIVNLNTVVGGYIVNPSWYTGNTVSAINFTGTGVLNINGDLYGAQTGTSGLHSLTTTAASTVNLIGNLYSPRLNNNNSSTTINSTGSGVTVNITGNIINTSAAITYNNQYSLYVTGANCTVNVTGNVTGDTSFGIYVNALNGIVNVIGTITVVSATSYPAIIFGTYSTILIASTPIINVGTANAVLVGKIRLNNAYSNSWTFVDQTNASRNLTYGTPSTGAYPAEADVKLGVAYAASPTRYGTCAVPLPQYVSQGVATGSTVGTAYLNAADVWNVLSSSITTAGSIGERLKVASTVETTGDQLAAYIV